MLSCAWRLIPRQLLKEKRPIAGARDRKCPKRREEEWNEKEMNSTGKKNRNYDYKLHPMSCTAVTFMAQQINSLKPNDNSSLKPMLCSCLAFHSQEDILVMKEKESLNKVSFFYSLISFLISKCLFSFKEDNEREVQTNSSVLWDVGVSFHSPVRLGNEERSNVLVPAPAVRLMKRRVSSRPGVNSVYSER